MTPEPDSDALDAEAYLFARYLLGCAPEPELVARYRAASRTLWPASPSRRDAALLAFVRRHPWSVGPLDAAAALLDPGGLLRSKILVTSAILETTPAHADAFLPRSASPLGLFSRLVASGVMAVAQAIAGALIYPLAVRVRS